MRPLILDANSPECRDAVWSHHVSEPHSRAVFPVERYDGTQGPKIVFQSAQRISAPHRRLEIWVKTLRLYSLTASIVPSLVLLAWAQGKGLVGSHYWSASTGVLASLGVILIHIAINQLNEVRRQMRFFLPDPESLRSKDSSNPASLLSGRNSTHPLREGWISPQTLSRWAFLAGGIGVSLGLPAVLQLQGQLPWVVLLGAVGIFVYLGLERRTSPRPGHSKDLKIVRDLLTLVLVGPALLAGLSLAYFGSISEELLWMGGALGAAAAAIVHANNLQDIPDDLTLSSRSLASALGFRVSKNVFALLYGISLLCVLVGTQSGPAALIVLLLALRPLGTLLKNVKNATGPTSPHLFGLRENAAMVHFRIGVGIAIHYTAFQVITL